MIFKNENDPWWQLITDHPFKGHDHIINPSVHFLAIQFIWIHLSRGVLLLNCVNPKHWKLQNGSDIEVTNE